MYAEKVAGSHASAASVPEPSGYPAERGTHIGMTARIAA